MAIPDLTLSGGKLSAFGGHKAVRQYRVWVRLKSGGDDSYFSLSPREVAGKGGYPALLKEVTRVRRQGNYTKVEKPVAVVWDAGRKKYREVVIDTKQ